MKLETVGSGEVESARNFIQPGKLKTHSPPDFKFIRKKDNAEKVSIADRFDTISQKSIEILSSKGLADFHHKRKLSDFVLSPDQNIFYSPKPQQIDEPSSEGPVLPETTRIEGKMPSIIMKRNIVNSDISFNDEVFEQIQDFTTERIDPKKSKNQKVPKHSRNQSKSDKSGDLRKLSSRQVLSSRRENNRTQITSSRGQHQERTCCFSDMTM